MNLAAGWSARGFRGKDGTLYNRVGRACVIPEEEDLFRLIGLPFCPPEERNV